MDRRGLLATALVAAGGIALLLLALSLTVEDPGRGPGDEGGRGGGDTGGDGGQQMGSGGGGGGGRIECVTWPLGLLAGLVALGVGWGIGALLASQGVKSRFFPPWALGLVLALPTFALVALAARSLCEPREVTERIEERPVPTPAPIGAPGGSGGGTPQVPPPDPMLLAIIAIVVLAILALVFLLARSRGGRAGGAALAADDDAAASGSARAAPAPLRTQDAREVVAAYVAACERLAAAGHARAPWETAGEYARRAPEAVREPFVQLTRLYEAVRHGDSPANAEATARAASLAGAVAGAAPPRQEAARDG